MVGKQIFDWPGFFMVIPLTCYLWIERKPVYKMALGLLFTACVFFLISGWLHFWQNPFEFFIQKIFDHKASINKVSMCS